MAETKPCGSKYRGLVCERDAGHENDMTLRDREQCGAWLGRWISWRYERQVVESTPRTETPRMTEAHVEWIEYCERYFNERPFAHEIASLVRGLVSGERDTYDPRTHRVVSIEEVQDVVAELAGYYETAHSPSKSNTVRRVLGKLRRWLNPSQEGREDGL